MNGKIDACADTGCGRCCCKFNEGNTILLSPGERAAAEACGESIQHLRYVDAWENGEKVVCTASNPTRCDDGYKPLDCKMYPLFPKTDDSGDLTWVHGEKCPLSEQTVEAHRSFAVRLFTNFIQENPTLSEWFKRAYTQLVGYKPYQRPAAPEWQPVRITRRVA